MSGPYFTDEEWEERLKKTNQQVTANHTVKMFNQSRTQWLASDGNPANEPKVGAILRIKLPNSYSLMQEKEVKMTRKEAIEKLQNNWMYKGIYADQFVAALEALELIKFDEEKSISAFDVLNGYTCYTSAILESLDKHGYKIVKK